MTVLSACQSAAIRLVGRKPSSIFSSTDKLALELADLSNEVAQDIAASHDWQALIKVHTINGDGTETAFDFPDDYARQLLHSNVMDANNYAWGYARVHDINDFIRMTEDGVQALPGSWIIYGNQMHFVPAPQDGAEATFPYVSDLYAQSTEGVPKAAFTADADVFRLPERLLILGLVWRWREQKRMDYGADQANFEKAFNEASGRDRGSRIHRTGPTRWAADVSVAYPYALGS